MDNLTTVISHTEENNDCDKMTVIDTVDMSLFKHLPFNI